jgi:hypothetical protein
MHNETPTPWPSFLSQRPSFDTTPHHHALMAAYAHAQQHNDPGPLPVPVWVFLQWLCEQHGFLLHGSGAPDIALFEPRQANDVGWFGNQQAVYATSDALWAMFFAILRRPEVPMSIVNGAIEYQDEQHHQNLYFFSVCEAAWQQQPLRDGYVYALPANRFVREPATGQYWPHHWASAEAVAPVLTIRVSPSDFPLLSAIRRHDERDLWRRVDKNPSGWPWLSD